MDMLSAIFKYNNNIEEYDNTVYQTIETRFVHLFNFLNQSAPFSNWFNRRLAFYLTHCFSYDCVVDLGFSIPYAYFYHDNNILNQSGTRFIFVDKEKSAIDFYNMILALPNLPIRARRDIAIQADLEDALECQRIVSKYRALEPKKTLIIASEIIEHLHNDAPCWELITDISRNDNEGSTDIYLTLPIGIKIPSHELWFSSNQDALDYAGEHLKIKESWSLGPPHELPPIPYAKDCVCILGSLKAIERI